MNYDVYALELVPGYYTELVITPHNHIIVKYKRIARDVSYEEALEQCNMYPQATVVLAVEGIITPIEK
jgi:hypothetical protein